MNTAEQITTIIAEALKVTPGAIKPETKLVDLAPDSIALFELLLRFEKMLGRSIAYEEIANIEIVGDIIRFAELLPADVLGTALTRQTQVTS
jgi:acyl carrier protein